MPCEIRRIHRKKCWKRLVGVVASNIKSWNPFVLRHADKMGNSRYSNETFRILEPQSRLKSLSAREPDSGGRAFVCGMSFQRECHKGTYSLASALADFGANTLAIVCNVGEALGLAEIGEAEISQCRPYLIDILKAPTPIPIDAARLCVYLCTQSRSILESLILEWLQDLFKIVKVYLDPSLTLRANLTLLD